MPCLSYDDPKETEIAATKKRLERKQHLDLLTRLLCEATHTITQVSGTPIADSDLCSGELKKWHKEHVDKDKERLMKELALATDRQKYFWTLSPHEQKLILDMVDV